MNKQFTVFYMALIFCGHGIASAQPLISIKKDDSGQSKVFLAGQISTKADIQAFETKVFTCTPVQPFKRGDKVAATVSDDQAWSIDEQPLQFGMTKIQYPVMAMIKCVDEFHCLCPAIIKMKTDIKAEETLNSDGYQITAARAVKAGDSVSVLFSGDSLLSVEGAGGAKSKSETKPWFTVYKDGATQSDRSATVEAWRLENDHLHIYQDMAGQISFAASWGDLERVKSLLKDNPGLVSSKDAWGMTPLHDAALGGSKAVVEFLLAHGADVNAPAKDWGTPLSCALNNDKFDVAKLLRQHGGHR